MAALGAVFALRACFSAFQESVVACALCAELFCSRVCPNADCDTRASETELHYNDEPIDFEKAFAKG